MVGYHVNTSKAASGDEPGAAFFVSVFLVLSPRKYYPQPLR